MTTRQHHQPATLISLATMAIIAMATSCIATTTIEEIEKPFTTKESDPAYTNMGYISITLQNNAEGTLLLLDSIELCNIKPANGTSTPNTTITRHQPALELTYSTTYTSATTPLPVQKFTPWTPDNLPEESTTAYIKIHGKLYTYIADGKTMLHCSGPMYTPLQGHINPGKSTNTTIEIYDNCPVYYLTDSTMTKILRSINFDIDIEDWE